MHRLLLWLTPLILFALFAAPLNADAQAVTVPDAFVQSWKDSGSFGKEIGCIIRAVSNLEKVGLTDVKAGKIIGAKPEPIRISAARHEYEGFQIVFTPLPGCAKNVTVTATAFKGPGAWIPASYITINPVGYIRVTPIGESEQLCPDPLLIGPIPDLAPGENQPVWISVKVPDKAPAGEYRGHVKITSPGVKSLSIPLVLKVRNFSIPKKISLRSSFWLFRDQINRYYNLDEVKLDDYFKWVDMALEHRLCPIDVYEGRCKQLLDTSDFKAWDRYIARMLAGGANTIHLGDSHHQGARFADEQNKVSSPAQVKKVIEYLAKLRDHYKELGVFDLHYCQLRDETSVPESLNVYRDVSQALPDVKTLLTAPSGDARPYLKIPCPLTPSFDAGWRDEVKAKGGEYWWYVACFPRDPGWIWANFFLNQDAVQHRVLFWETWQNDVEGLLYWGLNFWSWYETKWPAGGTGPNWRVPPPGAPNFCPLPDAPGDGFSMYPGPTPSQPLSSIRLEIMRDGEEDYEYFLMLDRLISKAEPSGKNRPAIERARAARQAALKLLPGMTTYERASAPYLDAREQIADSIEELSRL